MSDIRPVTEWRVSTRIAGLQERVLRSVGTEEFGATVRKAVLSLVGRARRLYLFEARGVEDTSLQYYCGEPGLARIFPDYRRWYLRQDPVCDAYRVASRRSSMALQRVRPGHIHSDGFRRRVFDEGGIVERVSVVQRGEDAWRVISVARHASDGLFSDRELDDLVGFAGLVLPLLPLNHRRGAGEAPLSVEQIEERFATRFPMLTRRERQVCACAASGMSVDASAAALGLRRTSVLTYRRRAYQRLEVSSALALRALVTR